MDAAGSSVRAIVDANPWYSFPFGFYADLSPDGSRLVYSSCEYPRCYANTGCENVEVEADDREAFSYEIATIGIDGTSPERLTTNPYHDHYPVWSPDGTRIAFLASPRLYFLSDEPDNIQLFTMSADGSERSKALTPSAMRVGLYPPTWSPDGQWLTFLGEGKSPILYTVRADGGSEPNRLGKTAVLPSWSPDSQWLAYADGAGIHRARPNGRWFAQVWEKSKEYPPITMVSWSPDGSELLFIVADDSELEGYGVFVVGANGRDLRHLPISRLRGWPRPAVWAVWSPDGSRIAVYGRGEFFGASLILTMARDASDMRFLARVDTSEVPYSNSPSIRDYISRNVGKYGGDGKFHAWNPPRSEKPDLSACSRGFVVPEPESNPGLVADCETLLNIRDTLAGNAKRGRPEDLGLRSESDRLYWNAELDWNEQVQISEWEGVTVDGSPPRVHELVLEGHGVRGRLPPELGRLAELRSLVIRGYTHLSYSITDALTGSIPPELGSLTKLQVLDLSGNYLSGRIPSELGSLSELRRLDLSYNFLTGSVPLELGSLMYLGADFGYNNPALCVPEELPERWRETSRALKGSVRVCSPEEVDSP